MRRLRATGFTAMELEISVPSVVFAFAVCSSAVSWPKIQSMWSCCQFFDGGLMCHRQEVLPINTLHWSFHDQQSEQFCFHAMFDGSSYNLVYLKRTEIFNLLQSLKVFFLKVTSKHLQEARRGNLSKWRQPCRSETSDTFTLPVRLTPPTLAASRHSLSFVYQVWFYHHRLIDCQQHKKATCKWG